MHEQLRLAFAAFEEICGLPSFGKRALLVVGAEFHVLAGVRVDVEQIDAALGQSMGYSAVHDPLAPRRRAGCLESLDLLNEVGMVCGIITFGA